MIVAIDGPAGSGKTTVAKKIAQKLDFLYLDTGATYRALTYSALKKEVDLSNELDLTRLARSLDLRLDKDKVYLDGSDITKEIRLPRIDKNISQIVAFAKVRRVMSALQRDIAFDKNYVVEGRDITTVVFPDAEFKFYLDADQKKRALRRIDQLIKEGENIDALEVEKDLINRDKADTSRKCGSLKLTEDAFYVDTTCLSADEVVDKLLGIVKFGDRPVSEKKD